MNNFQNHWSSLSKWVMAMRDGDNLGNNVETAIEFMEKLSEQFLVLTVTREEIDDLFGDRVGERMTDGQMAEIAAHMEFNEFLCDEKEEALKFAMDVLHDMELTPEEDDDEDMSDE